MTKYSHSSLCHAMLFCNQNMVVLLIHLALTKYYCCSNETMCWHFDKKAQEQIFEDNPVWFEISGMGVMGRFTRPLPLPAPLELPAPYPILPLPDWGLQWFLRNRFRLTKAFSWVFHCIAVTCIITDVKTQKFAPYHLFSYHFLSLSCQAWRGS